MNKCKISSMSKIINLLRKLLKLNNKLKKCSKKVCNYNKPYKLNNRHKPNKPLSYKHYKRKKGLKAQKFRSYRVNRWQHNRKLCSNRQRLRHSKEMHRL